MEVYRHCSGCRAMKLESVFGSYKSCEDCRTRDKKRRENTDTKAESIARRNRRHVEAVKQGRPVIEGEDYNSVEKAMYLKQGIKPLYTRFNDEDFEQWELEHNSAVQLKEKRDNRLQQAADFMANQTAERVPCGLCSVERPRKVMFEGLCVSCRKELVWQGQSYIDQFLDQEDHYVRTQDVFHVV